MALFCSLIPNVRPALKIPTGLSPDKQNSSDFLFGGYMAASKQRTNTTPLVSSTLILLSSSLTDGNIYETPIIWPVAILLSNFIIHSFDYRARL